MSEAFAPAGPAARVTVAALVAAGSGAVLSLQGRLNGDLGAAGTGPVLAAWLSYVGTLLGTVLVIVVRRRVRSTLAVVRSTASWWWFAVGLCSVPIVVAMAAGIPLVGVAVASVCAVAGQTVAGLALDARGVGLPAPLRLTPRRAGAGLAAVAGLGIAVLGSSAGGPGWAVVAAGTALFVGGAVLCGQQAGNGRVTELTGDPVVATLTSVTGGLAGITLVCALGVPLGLLDGVTLPAQWWLYLGGPLGTLVTVAAACAVRHLGTFVLTLTVVGGQMVMAVLLDAVGAVGLRWPTVAATAVVALAVLLAVPRRAPRASRRVERA
ncbi:DMT family transporter [Cellulosimicrobium sp. BE325]|uniref:DMT family transporter n=1 Tax=Cellulosimicrobium sp. 4261 TaxID=3156458 RepID=UPI001AE6E17D